MVISHSPRAIGVVAGAVLAMGCGRTEMDPLVRVSTGSGGAIASTGGAGGAASGPCADASCLASLFATCVPEGSCTVQGGNSPSASFNNACYANGVTVSRMATYSGSSTIDRVAVGRKGVPCYSIETSLPTMSNGLTYVVRGGDGQEIATGALVDKTGTVAVACGGGPPTRVSHGCLEPAGDNGTCRPGSCP